jgi:glycerophosphoryl diester phosphodiesterase
VKLMTHRGLTSQAPENSLAALEAAWRAGLHGAEIDVRTAKDGVLVLMHDATLLRTTNGSGMVEHTVWQSLQKLRLKGSRSGLSSQGIPSLDQALAWAAKRPGFKLALDLKQADPVAVGKLVVKHGLMSRVDLYVGGPERAGLIRKIKAYNPALRVSLNLGWWWKVEGSCGLCRQGRRCGCFICRPVEFPGPGIF